VKKVLLDTNILSYFLRGQSSVVEKLRQYGTFHDSLTFSLLTYYEIKAGLTYRDSQKLLERFEELANESEVLLLTQQTMNIGSEIYSDLRQRGLLIPPMDLLIAASALEYNYNLITANIRHFENIRGLTCENWT
jgi:tRNA(fMet)-specific endonuclease VapC